MRYFAMLDTEDVVLIPGATTFEEAAEKEPAGCHWIFHKEGLQKFVNSATDQLLHLEEPPECAHEWNQTPGEADESGGRIYCLKCGADGDA